MRAPRALFIVALMLNVSGDGVEAQTAPLDYPQWRGQQRDGAASAFVAPTTWPTALTRRWRVEVGEGYATPLLIGDTIYAFTRRGESEGLTALNATTGEEQWSSHYPAPYVPSGPTTAHGAGPKATPLFHEGRLFTLGISGIVTAFDPVAGTQLWQTPPPLEPPFFSAASSPLGVEGLVLVHPGNYGPLTAYDSRTGRLRWSAGSGGFFASPILADMNGTRQIIAATQDSVIGVAIDGRVLWRYPWKGGAGSTTPVLYDGTVIVSAPEEGMAAFTPVVRDGIWLVETRWRTSEVAMYLSNPVVVADAVFGLSTRQRGQFFAVDAQSGKVLWLGPPREADNTAVVKSGNLLVLLNNDAELIVAHASRTGFEPVARYTVAASETWAQPMLSGRRILVKDVTSLTLWTID